jgi:hypothetical protein
MYLRKLFLLLSVLALFFVSYSAVPSGFNEKKNTSFEDLYLDMNGWCSQVKVPMAVYSKSDWDNRDTIERDEDLNFTIFDTYVQIFNPPFESESNLVFSKQTKSLESFDYVFQKPSLYLIQVYAKGDYNPLEIEQFEIVECKGVSEEVKEVLSPQNITLTLGDFSFEIYDTLSKISEITFETFDQKNLVITNPVSEPYKTFRISFPKDFSSTGMKITSPVNTNSTYTLYTYNFPKKSLDVVKKGVTFTNDTFTFTKIDSGYYILNEILPEIEEEIIVEETKQQTNQEIQSKPPSPLESVQEPSNPIEEVSGSGSSMISYVVYVFIGIIVVVLLFLSPKLFSTKKKEEDLSHLEGSGETHLVSYSQTYQEAKKYVLQYKDSYSRESLTKALEQAGVDSSIIVKVMEEVYTQEK